MGPRKTWLTSNINLIKSVHHTA